VLTPAPAFVDYSLQPISPLARIYDGQCTIAGNTNGTMGFKTTCFNNTMAYVEVFATTTIPTSWPYNPCTGNSILKRWMTAGQCYQLSSMTSMMIVSGAYSGVCGLGANQQLFQSVRYYSPNCASTGQYFTVTNINSGGCMNYDYLLDNNLFISATVNTPTSSSMNFNGYAGLGCNTAAPVPDFTFANANTAGGCTKVSNQADLLL
jgi:hypothetical protein